MRQHHDSIDLSKISAPDDPEYFAEERDLMLRSNPQINKTQESIEGSGSSQKHAPPEIVDANGQSPSGASPSNTGS